MGAKLSRLIGNRSVNRYEASVWTLNEQVLKGLDKDTMGLFIGIVETFGNSDGGGNGRYLTIINPLKNALALAKNSELRST